MKLAPDRGPILLVDDDEDIRESIGYVLEDLEYAYLTAPNGRDALTLARGASPAPSLILLDLAMPVMTGWQFLEERENDAALAAIPVIVMTAATDSWVNSVPARASGMLRKPVEYEQLVEAITELAPRVVSE